MKDIHYYLKRLNISLPLVANYKFLSQFHHAHFYSIPFENIGMKKILWNYFLTKILQIE